MLSSFWRRKNVRLVQRLNAAIETSERLNEVYNAPKPPRVVIDTSYVDHRSRHPAIADHDEGEYGVTDSELLDLKHSHEITSATGHIDTHDAGGSLAFERGDESAMNEAWGCDISLFKEAVEQLELAEQREAEALQELERMRRRTEELEAAVTAEKEARRTAEAASDEAKAAVASATEELATLRSLADAPAARAGAETEVRARLEAKLMLEQAARREAEAQRDTIKQSLSQANDEIEELRKVAAEAAAATTNLEKASNESGTLDEITTLRSRNEELATEAARAREALSCAEADVKAARQAAEVSLEEVDILREAATKAGKLEQELTAAKTREAEASAKAQDLETRIQELETQISGIERERTAERESSRKESDEAAAELTALRLAAKRLTEQHTRESDDARKRHDALLKDVESLRGHIAGLEAAAAKERETARKAIESANKEIATLRAAAQELADNSTRASGEAEQRTEAALTQIEALRQEIAKLEKNRDVEHQAAATAAAEAAAEIEALRLAAREIATSRAQTETQESSKMEALRSELDALRQHADKLEAAHTAAEAARRSAELDRDNARKELGEAESGIATLRHQLQAQPASPDNVTAEPPVFRPASLAKAVVVDPQSAAAAGRKSASESSQALVRPPASKEHSEDAAPQFDENQTRAMPQAERFAPQQIAIMPPPQSQTSEAVAVAGDTATPTAPDPSGFTVYSNDTEASAATNEIERRGREKRVPSRMAVTLWTEAWGQPLSCFLADKSSRGAKIEMKPDRIFGGNNRINVGDRLTLTFYYAHERTSVFCDVMWMEDNFLGVKYYGQFHTEFNKPRPTQRRGYGTGD